MDTFEKILINKKNKNLIDKLSDETVILIAKDPLKALEAAEKGVKKEEPEQANNVEYIQSIADEIQKSAHMIIKNRGIRFNKYGKNLKD